MEFHKEEQVFTIDRVENGIYPTENLKAIVRDYKSSEKRYLLEFEKYVGGFAIKYRHEDKDKLTKVGFGLWVKETDISKIKYYREIENDNKDDEIESEE